MIPEEDLGPTWLRDYGYTDFGDIAADIAAMEEFAKKLATDVQDNYRPHMHSVSSSMLTELPAPNAEFAELVTFFQTHRDAQSITQSNVYNFADGTDTFAAAAQTISKEYEGADAFSRARVSDVQDAFHKPDPLVRPQQPTSEPGGDA
jgi:hypothetical protein